MSATELAGKPTVFEDFMGYMDRRQQTLGQLLAIYRERSSTLDPAEDRADDLRVERFMRDMADARWNSDVVIRVGVFDGRELVIDGIHRGLAYLACIDAGVSAEQLPALQLAC